MSWQKVIQDHVAIRVISVVTLLTKDKQKLGHKQPPLKLLSQLVVHPILQRLVVSGNKPFKNMISTAWID